MKSRRQMTFTRRHWNLYWAAFWRAGLWLVLRMGRRVQVRRLRWMVCRSWLWRSCMNWRRKIIPSQCRSFKFMEGGVSICSMKKLSLTFCKTSRESFKFLDWWKRMQPLPKNFWRLCNRRTTVERPMRLLPMILHRDRIRFVRFLSGEAIKTVGLNWCWSILQAVKGLRIRRVTIDRGDWKEQRLTRGTNVVI